MGGNPVDGDSLSRVLKGISYVVYGACLVCAFIVLCFQAVYGSHGVCVYDNIVAV